MISIGHMNRQAAGRPEASALKGVNSQIVLLASDCLNSTRLEVVSPEVLEK